VAWTTPTLRITGELITAAIWNTDLVADLLVLKTAIDDAGNLSFPAASALTLASDACTPTQNLHKIDTEAAASTDNLSTLSIAGTIRTGHVLRLTANNLSHVVTVKDSVGNIVLKKGDFALNATDRWIELMLFGSTWYELGRSDINGAIAGPELRNFTETKTSQSIASNSVTLDYSAGSVFEVTLNANLTTITLSNLPASGKAALITLTLKQDATGGRTVTFPAGWKWPSAVVPVVTSTLNKADIYVLVTYDGGTTVYASVFGQNF
jgi:hypothetical protein